MTWTIDILVIKNIFMMITPFLVVILAYLLNRKLNGNNTKIADKVDMLISKQVETDLSVNRMEAILSKHVGEDSFRQKFRNSIKKVLEKNIGTPLLLQPYKNVLAYWGDSIVTFAFNYYYFPEKRTESMREREKFLNNEKKIMIKEFSKYIDTVITEVKTNKNTNEKFSAFLETNRVYDGLEILIMTLAKNGLKDFELQEIFSDYLDKFCELVITASMLWEHLASSKGPFAQAS